MDLFTILLLWSLLLSQRIHKKILLFKLAKLNVNFLIGNATCFYLTNSTVL